MKVYVITQGEYSDYHICGVAVDAECAEKIRKYFDDEWDPANIEEYDTDDYVEGNVRERYIIIIDKRGNVEKHSTGDVAPFKTGEDRFWWGVNRAFCAEIWAKDQDHALKIAFDKRAKLLAEELGI